MIFGNHLFSFQFLFFHLINFSPFAYRIQAWVEDSVISIATQFQHSHEILSLQYASCAKSDTFKGAVRSYNDYLLYACYDKDTSSNSRFLGINQPAMPVSYLTTGPSSKKIEYCDTVGKFEEWLEYVMPVHHRDVVDVAARVTGGMGLATRTVDNNGIAIYMAYLANGGNFIARETSLSNSVETQQIYKVTVLTTVFMPATATIIPVEKQSLSHKLPWRAEHIKLIIFKMVFIILSAAFAISVIKIIAKRFHALKIRRPRLGSDTAYRRPKRIRYKENNKRFSVASRGEDTIKDISSPAPSKSAQFVDDNGRTVQFKWYPDTIKPGLGDWVKSIVESWLRYPVIWWPLKPRRAYCSTRDLRVSWYCVSIDLEQSKTAKIWCFTPITMDCGEELYVDLLWSVANDYRKKCIRVTLPSGIPSLLPIHNLASESTSSSSSTRAQITGQGSSNAIQRLPYNNLELNAEDPTIRDAQQANIVSDLIRNRYIHWCVDAKRYETRLFHIPIPSMTDITVISALKTAYNDANGIRRWFSLTACYGVKFIRFQRCHRSKELVACGEEDLPNPDTNQEYDYNYLDPREQFMKTLERSLMHHLHNPLGCGAHDIEDVLKRIPKKTNGKLKMRFGAAGYGMYAVPGWAFWKLLVALFLTQIGPLIFAIRWLCGHPGDLQNAFILSFYLVGLLNIAVVVPDIWSMRT